MNTLPVWNLNDLYASVHDEAVERDLKSAALNAEAFQFAYRGKLNDLTPAEFAQALVTYENIGKQMGKLESFADLKHAENVSDEEGGRFLQKITEKSAEIGTKTLFFCLEINALSDERMAELMNDETVARYRPFLQNVRLYKPHDLSSEIEEILLEKDTVSEASFIRLYDEIMASLKVDDGKGGTQTFTEAIDKFNDPDRDVRRQTGKAVADVLNAQMPTVTLIYNTLLQSKRLEDKWRHYETPESFRHLSNRVESNVVEALSEAVWEKLPTTAHRYYKLKAKVLGLDKLQHYDRNAPVFTDIAEKSFSWPEAQETVLNAYRDFSPEFYQIGKQFFDKHWIDAEPRSGKAQGAFAHPTTTDVHPYILLSFLGKTRDVMTIAHELGHGIHMCLSAPQGYLMAHSPLTFAETASVFGEMLTFQSLLKQESNPAVRRALLSRKIEDMINTVVRQTAFYRFEKTVHEERKNGELSRQRLNAIWQSVQSESLGNAFDFSTEYDPYWSYISHFFHTPFYVYAYAFGDCLVNALYTTYNETDDKSAFVARYTDMLKKGGTQTHRDMLSPFGLNAGDKSFWSKGLKVLEDFINRFESDLP